MTFQSRIVLLPVLTTVFAWSTVAQTVAGMGGLSGTVRDATGASVPAAQVVIANAGKGIRRTMETNDAGLFTASALVPASGYVVTVNKTGFTEYEAKNLEILVGQQVDLGITLQVATATTQIEVVSTTPLVEPTKTDVSQVVESRQIMDLPINGRRVDSFVLLTPGVTNDGTFGMLTFRGVAGGNSFLVDGNDTTEQFYNENAGRTRIATQISQDAVQEFQVVSSNFSAEYGRASGGVVNTVTRSGTNDLHGTAYWFFRNRTLNAQDRYATFNPPEVRHQTGASIGGPIRKDKLFYFFNVDITRRNFPIASSINRPAVVDPIAKTFVGCGSPATPAQCAAINPLIPGFFRQVPRQANQELALGKLDWRPTERNSFSASFNFLRYIAPMGLQSAAAINTGSAISGNADDSVRVRNGRVSWIGIPSASMVNEFRFGWFTDRQADDFDPLSLLPTIGYVDLGVASQFIGPLNYLPRVQPSEQRFQFADNLSWTKGKHTFKFGVDIANSDDYSYYIQNTFGNYTYQTVTNFAQDYSGNTAGGKHWQTYQQGFGNPVVDTTIRDNGFYAQDQYRVTPSLTLNYGLRYEYAALPQPKIVNPDFPQQTGHINSSNLNLAPRLGVAYSFDKGKMVLRAGWGMYHARFTGALLDDLFVNNGIYQLSSTLQGSNATQLAAGPVFPNILPSAPSNAAGSSTIQFLAPNARTPYTEQGTLGLERQLASGIAVTASFVWSRGIQLLAVRDLNMGGPSGTPVIYTIDDAKGNVVGTYATPTYMSTDVINKKYQRVLQDENGINSYYNALVLQVRKRFSRGLQANASYTWAHEIDDGQGAGSNALFFSGFSTSSISSSNAAVTFNGNYKFDKGSGTLDQRHRFVLSFVEQPTFTHRDGAFYKYAVNNWQLSAIMTLASGRPQMPYIFTQDTPVTGMAYNTSLNGFGGSPRVPFWPVNSLYTPPIYRGDARISKVLPFGERFKVFLNFEVFNLTNTIVDTQLFNEAFTERGRVLTPYAPYGVGNASTGFPDGTNARRAQVSARFVF